MNAVNPFTDEIAEPVDPMLGTIPPDRFQYEMDMYVLHHISFIQKHPLVVEMKRLLSEGFCEFMLSTLRELQLILERVIDDTHQTAHEASHPLNIRLVEELSYTELFIHALNNLNTWYTVTRKAKNLTLTTALPTCGVRDLIIGMGVAAGRFMIILPVRSLERRYVHVRHFLMEYGYPNWRSKMMSRMCAFSDQLKERMKIFYAGLSDQQMHTILPMRDMFQAFALEENGMKKMHYYSLLVDDQKELSKAFSENCFCNFA